MKSPIWRKITVIATVIGILGTSFSANSFADEIVVSEETEFFAEQELDTAESFYSEDEFIVEESDDAIASVDDGIFTMEEETETVVEEGLSMYDLGDELDVQTETDNELYLTASSDDLEDTVGLTGGVGTGTIMIASKVRVLSDEKTTNPTNKEEIYSFALCKDSPKNPPISTKTLKVSRYNYKSSESVSFDNLEEGVYYLKEIGTTGIAPEKIKYVHTYLDTDGKWKRASGTQSDEGIKITVQRNDSSSQDTTVVDAHKIAFTNVYSQADTLKGSFKIKVRVVDENNKETPTTLTAGFTVKWDAGGKSWTVNPNPSLSLKDVASLASKEYTITFSSEDQQATVKVRMMSLTDENGNNVAGKYTLVDDTDYTMLNSYEKTIDITDGLTDGVVIFTLKEVPTEQEIGELTLKKEVKYHDVPFSVDATYYLGVFTDAAHEKLLYNKSLSLSNESSRTSTLKINLSKLKNEDHSITLYFAETTENGDVLQSGEDFGYRISLDNNAVTLSPDFPEASVTLTNEILDGTKMECDLVTGHRWNAGRITKVATSTTTGIKTYTCKSCGETKTVVIPKLKSVPKTLVEKITISKKPSIKKPAAAKGKITVKWKHFKHTSKKTKKIWKKIKKVQIQCATDKTFKNKVKDVKIGRGKTKYAIKGLKKKTTYYVRVRYYDGTGYSAWSKVKKVKTK